MNLLWTQSPRSVRDVMDTLPQQPAYTTIATVMQNLLRKDMVEAVRHGRLVSYRPQLSREEYVAKSMRHALDTSSDRAASMLHFVQEMPAEDLQMLRDYLGQTPSAEPADSPPQDHP